MTFLFHSYSFDHYKWNINFILLLIVVNKNCKMNVLKMNPRGAMTPCHCHRDLLLTLDSRRSGDPKQSIGKYNYYWVVHFFPNKMYSVRKIMPIHHRRKSTVSLAHAHWPWTNQLNFSRFHEYLYFYTPCNKKNENFLVFGNMKTKIMLEKDRCMYKHWWDSLTKAWRTISIGLDMVYCREPEKSRQLAHTR